MPTKKEKQPLSVTHPIPSWQKRLIWLLGILTFGGLYFYTGGGVEGVFMAFLCFIPAFVIVLILYLGAVQIADEIIKPFWKWLVK